MASKNKLIQRCEVEREVAAACNHKKAATFFKRMGKLIERTPLGATEIGANLILLVGERLCTCNRDKGAS